MSARDTLAALAVSPELLAWIEDARQRKVTPEEIAAQRRSYVAAQMAIGSDADEAEYRTALAAGDEATLARLNAEAEARQQRALQTMQEMGL